MATTKSNKTTTKQELRDEIDRLRTQLRELTESAPEAAITYVIAKSMSTACVPTEVDGVALSTAQRFDLLMRDMDRTMRFTRPFIDLIEMAEDVKAPNFVTGCLKHGETEWECTVRRPCGKTPTEVIHELRAELAAANGLRVPG